MKWRVRFRHMYQDLISEYPQLKKVDVWKFISFVIRKAVIAYRKHKHPEIVICPFCGSKPDAVVTPKNAYQCSDCAKRWLKEKK